MREIGRTEVGKVKEDIKEGNRRTKGEDGKVKESINRRGRV